MSQVSFEPDTLKLELDTTELDDTQKRLIKKINNLLVHVMTTDEECDYFDASSDLMKMVACSVKDSNFSKYWKQNSSIPYALQALEYCMDSISDDLSDANIKHYDN